MPAGPRRKAQCPECGNIKICKGQFRTKCPQCSITFEIKTNLHEGPDEPNEPDPLPNITDTTTDAGPPISQDGITTHINQLVVPEPKPKRGKPRCPCCASSNFTSTKLRNEEILQTGYTLSEETLKFKHICLDCSEVW